MTWRTMWLGWQAPGVLNSNNFRCWPRGGTSFSMMLRTANGRRHVLLKGEGLKLVTHVTHAFY